MQMLDTSFWVNLYTTGQWGAPGHYDLLIMIVVRLLVIGLILLGARLLVSILARIIKRAMHVASERAGHARRRLKTLQGLLISVIVYVVYFVAVLLVLFALGLTWKGLAPLLGAASVIGLAIGFGAQKLVRDIITGFFILGEGQFDVGDWVTIGTVTGRVEDMGLRVTRLCDEQGRAYIVANGDITQVYNASRGFVAAGVTLTVKREAGIDTTLERVKRLLEETLAASSVEIDTARTQVRLQEITADKVTLHLSFWAPVSERPLLEHTLRRRLAEAGEAGEIALA